MEMSSNKNNGKINKQVNKSCLGILAKRINFDIGKNAKYKLRTILSCLIFCAMGKLYFESGLEELANRIRQKIPSADVVNRRIKKKSKEEVIQEFMEIQNDLFSKFRKMRLLMRRVIAMIDITEIPYWGDKNDKGVVGTKKQKGTSYCYQYISIHILVNNFKVCLYVLPVTVFSNKAKLVEELLSVAKRKVRIGLVLIDRGLANSKIIPVIEKHGLKYLAPITKNEKISDIIRNLYWNKRNYNCDEICIYTFDSGINTKLFFTINKIKESAPKLSERYFCWCTNLNVKTENREFLAEIYGRRWNIENFYRDSKGNFLIKTKSKEFTIRLFFFLFCTILYNLWQLIKALIREPITAQRWKNSVYELLHSSLPFLYKSENYEKMIWNLFL